MPRADRRAHADALDCGMIETAPKIYNRGCAEFAIEACFPFADKRVVVLSWDPWLAKDQPGLFPDDC